MRMVLTRPFWFTRPGNMVPQVDLCYHWIQQLVVDAQLDGIFGATAPMSLGLKDLMAIYNGFQGEPPRNQTSKSFWGHFRRHRNARVLAELSSGMGKFGDAKKRLGET